jgi:hypothetical protein
MTEHEFERVLTTPKLTLIRDNKFVYTIDVDSIVHSSIVNNHPICMWQYTNDSSSRFGCTRLQVLKHLYVRLCLQYS